MNVSFGLPVQPKFQPLAPGRSKNRPQAAVQEYAMTRLPHTASVSPVSLTLAFFLAGVSDPCLPGTRLLIYRTMHARPAMERAENASKAIGGSRVPATLSKCLKMLTRPIIPMDADGNASGVTGKSPRPAWLLGCPPMPISDTPMGVRSRLSRR